MYGKYRQELKNELEEITQSGLYKSERHITSAQQARVRVGEKQVVNMCANNNLGLANSHEIIKAVKAAREFGLKVESALVIVDRDEQDGRARVEAEGLTLLSLLTMKDLKSLVGA